MTDGTIATQISELRAQLEALEASISDSNRVDSVKHTKEPKESVIEPVPTPKVKFGDDGSNSSELSDAGTKSLEAVKPPPPETLVTGEDADAANSTPAEIIPQLNLVNWTQFKNIIVNEPKRYAIDVLVGPAKFYWQKRRAELNLQQGSSEDFSVPVPTKPAELHLPDKPTIIYEHAQGQFEMPERVRINCDKLPAILGDISESSLGSKPLVMLLPYKLLVRYDETIRQRLRDLEAHGSTTLGAPQHHQRPDGGLHTQQLDDPVVTFLAPVRQLSPNALIRTIRALIPFL